MSVALNAPIVRAHNHWQTLSTTLLLQYKIIIKLRKEAR